MVRINDDLEIPDAELGFEFSRSGGPGGQNVNKVETRVTLRFPVGTSPSLTEEQRSRIYQALANRITKDGELLISASTERTREANRKEAVARFTELVAEALVEDAERRETRVPRRERRRRLRKKRQRSRVKELRNPPSVED